MKLINFKHISAGESLLVIPVEQTMLLVCTKMAQFLDEPTHHTKELVN